MSAHKLAVPKTWLGIAEDRLEIHPHDAEDRGVNTGDWVGIKSRAGETVLRALGH
jgi:predicted molibdopterin-dependent oxidoreductase YjgC